MNLHICDIDNTLIDPSHREALLEGWAWNIEEYWDYLSSSEQWYSSQRGNPVMRRWRFLSEHDGFTPLVLSMEDFLRSGDTIVLVTGRFFYDANQAKNKLSNRLKHCTE